MVSGSFGGSGVGGQINGGGSCVDRVFIRTWSRWPWTITADQGGYLRTRSEVISGHKVKFPTSSALHSVDRAGLPRALWRDAMRSEMVV